MKILKEAKINNLKSQRPPQQWLIIKADPKASQITEVVETAKMILKQMKTGLVLVANLKAHRKTINVKVAIRVCLNNKNHKKAINEAIVGVVKITTKIIFDVSE